MSSAAIIAYGAVSGLGRGLEALGMVEPGARARTAIGRDEELCDAKLVKPYCARVREVLPTRGDRATALFALALDDCARALDEALPDWRSRRIGLAVGTSSGGMRRFEELARDRLGRPPHDWTEATYLGPVLHAARPVAVAPFTLVLGACASSTLAIGLGRAWLEQDRCDVALVGGFDALGVFVAAGFEVLRATSAVGEARPFRTDRDGLVLGEGAVMMALTREGVGGAVPVLGHVVGFGASCDAVHLTAPDRTGAGLARAAEQALVDAGRPSVDRLSAHGTATDFNDASEALAVAAVLGASRAAEVPLHAFKGSIGHTLGAAGGLETLSILEAMRRGVALPSIGRGAPIGTIRVLDHAEAHEAEIALKLSAAFGGANAAVALAKTSPPSSSPVIRRPVFVSRAAVVPSPFDEPIDPHRLAVRTGYSEDKIARTDRLVRSTMAAVAALEDAVGPLRGAGIVVGHGLATLETNAAFWDRIGKSGAARAEPRRFPFTTPNAGAGETAIAFGLTGPAFAVGGGAHGGLEALSVARTLVAAGVAERIVVVAVDEGGEASRWLAPGTSEGAVALLVSADAVVDGGALLEAEVTLAEGPPPDADADAGPVTAHAALLPLARPASGVSELTLTTAWGITASARIAW